MGHGKHLRAFNWNKRGRRLSILIRSGVVGMTSFISLGLGLLAARGKQQEEEAEELE
jgi:hypothetical protein